MTPLGLNSLENRLRMVSLQLKSRNITDPRVLDAMSEIPRERFLKPELHADAYRDGPLPIGDGQTISQPYIVAYMCQLLALEPHHQVLEVGAGCGYQAAVLARLGGHVVAIERLRTLYQGALQILSDEISRGKLHLVWGDGSLGYAQAAPYDRIIVSAAISGENPPLLLWSQLKPDGMMVAPMGDEHGQHIYILTKKEGGMDRRKDLAVSFVPFIQV